MNSRFETMKVLGWDGIFSGFFSFLFCAMFFFFFANCFSPSRQQFPNDLKYEMNSGEYLSSRVHITTSVLSCDSRFQLMVK